MEALASPSSCRASSSSSGSSVVFGREKRGLVSRLESCFLRTRRASGFGPLSSIFVQQSKPISPLSCLSPKTQVELGEVNVQTEEKYQSKTRTFHVKFQLEKECLFGQQFFMVGDDPMFGLWDPESAVPLTWSEQHVWFAELDIPVGKLIQYKFILKDGTGMILWQPGPDRVFQAWETENIIVVSDDWENAEFHVITEEERNSSPNNNSGMVFGANVKTARDTIPPSFENPKTRVTSSKSEVANQRRVSSTSEISAPLSKKDVVIGEDLLGNSGITATIVNFEGEPVLVPGLPPLPEFSAEEDNYNQVGEKISLNDSVEALEAEDNSSTESQLDEKQEQHGNQRQKGKTDEMTDDEEQKPESELQQPNVGKRDEQSKSEPKNDSDVLLSDLQCKTDEQSKSEPKNDGDVLLNDLQWGQKTLQKFLTNFGFF